ncbi:MAG: hypothetical protein V1860_01710 [bacterium]
MQEGMIKMDELVDEDILTEKEEREDSAPLADKKVEHLTSMDSLQVAYLEGKAYYDNKSLMEYLHNMENDLIAKDINNVSKDRVNLSLKCVDDKKKMQGYILAYEGKMDKKGEDIIFIADLAASPESKMAGGRLIKEFIGLYKKYYLDEGKLIPIVADAREKTSYQIILKQAEKMGKELGVKFRIEEIGEEEKGEDIMHLVKIIPEKEN